MIVDRKWRSGKYSSYSSYLCSLQNVILNTSQRDAGFSLNGRKAAPGKDKYRRVKYLQRHLSCPCSAHRVIHRMNGWLRSVATALRWAPGTGNGSTHWLMPTRTRKPATTPTNREFDRCSDTTKGVPKLSVPCYTLLVHSSHLEVDPQIAEDVPPIWESQHSNKFFYLATAEALRLLVLLPILAELHWVLGLLPNSQ